MKVGKLCPLGARNATLVKHCSVAKGLYRARPLAYSGNLGIILQSICKLGSNDRNIMKKIEIDDELYQYMPAIPKALVKVPLRFCVVY